MEDLLAIAAAHSIRYLRGRDDRSVFPNEEGISGLSDFVEPMPLRGTDPVDVLELLAERAGPATVTTTGGRYFGFVTGGAHPVGVGAAWMAATWDQNAALNAMSPAAAIIDTLAGAWLGHLFGLPQGTQHTFTSGTSSANAQCLAVARDALLAEQGWDAVNDGLFGAPPLRIVVSDAAHSSVTKALGMVGLGRTNVMAVPSDDQGRLIAAELPEAGEPTLVILQAGNVNTGSFDPFTDVADHYADTPHWIHVDGAFGLWAAASPTTQPLMEGFERAHSWATDMHKWLNVTYDSAAAFVRSPQDMARTFKVGADYLPSQAAFEPVHRGMDMSQRARAIETWAVLKTLGAIGVAGLVDRCCEYAKRLGDELSEAGFVVHNDVVLNQVLVSLESDSATNQLIEDVQTDGSIWAGGSVWNGVAVMRLSVSSWATSEADIDVAVETLMRLSKPRTA